MQIMKRRQQKATPTLKKRHRTKLKPKKTDEEQWKELVTGLKDLRIRNEGKRDHFHHEDGTFSSSNRPHPPSSPKHNYATPRRLSKDFFYPPGVSLHEKLISARSPRRLRPIRSPKSEDRHVRKVVGHLVDHFQRKRGMKLFYLFDVSKKGHLNRHELHTVLDRIGYESLAPAMKNKVVDKLMSLKPTTDPSLIATSDTTAKDVVTMKDLRGIELDSMAPPVLGQPLVRQSEEERLYSKYLDPLHPKEATDGELFYCGSSAERARQIVTRLQNRYQALDKPLTKLRAWDINKDGRIEKDEMDGLLRKMNINFSDAELSEFFDIFHRNEKAKHIQERCFRRKQSTDTPQSKDEAKDDLSADFDPDSVSYPIFLRTIMNYDFAESAVNRNCQLLPPPLLKRAQTQSTPLDADSMRILQRLRKRAESKFGPKHLVARTFRYLDSNCDATVDRDEFAARLKFIDSNLTAQDTQKLIEAMDPEQEGSIKFGQFAQCFNRPIRSKLDYPLLRQTRRPTQAKATHQKSNFSIFDSDPNSTYFVEDKERFRKGPVLSERRSPLSRNRPTKKNLSNSETNILHHT